MKDSDRKSAEAFIDRWTNDPSFARQLGADPENALRNCGIEPEEELVDVLKDVDPEMSVEGLKKRISKWWLLWHGGWQS